MVTHSSKPYVHLGMVRADAAERMADAMRASDRSCDVELSDDDVIGAASVLMAQLGHAKAAALMLDVTSARFERHSFVEETMDYSYERGYQEVILELEPHLIHNTGYLPKDVKSAFETVGAGCGRNIEDVDIREVIPKVGPNWRE